MQSTAHPVCQPAFCTSVVARTWCPASVYGQEPWNSVNCRTRSVNAGWPKSAHVRSVTVQVPCVRQRKASGSLAKTRSKALPGCSMNNTLGLTPSSWRTEPTRAGWSDFLKCFRSGIDLAGQHRDGSHDLSQSAGPHARMQVSVMLVAMSVLPWPVLAWPVHRLRRRHRRLLGQGPRRDQWGRGVPLPAWP